MYAIKEAFYSLQGEGARAGRASVFCRFTGCNLWSGREQDRWKSRCQFCDTDFIGTDGQHGGRFASAEQLALHIETLWAPTSSSGRRYVVFTGGEPLLQLDAPLIEAVHARGFEIAVETNGTLKAPAGIDWICVSPKGSTPIVQTSGQELKLVYPQSEAQPEHFAAMAFEHFFLQPMDLAPTGKSGTTQAQALAYCLQHPQWQLSLQLHKIIGID